MTHSHVTNFELALAPCTLPTRTWCLRALVSCSVCGHMDRRDVRLYPCVRVQWTSTSWQSCSRGAAWLSEERSATEQRSSATPSSAEVSRECCWICNVVLERGRKAWRNHFLSWSWPSQSISFSTEGISRPCRCEVRFCGPIILSLASSRLVVEKQRYHRRPSQLFLVPRPSLRSVEERWFWYFLL